MAIRSSATARRSTSDESQVRALEKVFRARGISVRREKLARGSAFRVRSGGCLLAGENLIFIDRRLPDDQQLTLLIEYLGELRITLTERETAALAPRVRSMIAREPLTVSSEALESSAVIQAAL